MALTSAQPTFDPTALSAPTAVPIVTATAQTEIRPLPGTLYDMTRRPVPGTALSYLGSQEGSVTNPQDAKDMPSPAWIPASALAISQGIANYFQQP